MTIQEDGRIAKCKCASNILNKNLKFKLKIMYIYLPSVWINLFSHSQENLTTYVNVLFSNIIKSMQIILQLFLFLSWRNFSNVKAEGLIFFLKAQNSDCPRDGSQHLL